MIWTNMDVNFLTGGIEQNCMSILWERGIILHAYQRYGKWQNLDNEYQKLFNLRIDITIIIC